MVEFKYCSICCVVCCNIAAAVAGVTATKAQRHFGLFIVALLQFGWNVSAAVTTTTTSNGTQYSTGELFLFHKYIYQSLIYSYIPTQV